MASVRGSQLGVNSNFHFELVHLGFSFKFRCATTRGIICWYTIGCSYPLFGAFVGSFVIRSVVVGLIVVGSIIFGSSVFGSIVFQSVVFVSFVVGS